jgi:putative ABC transport system ATP-binding protein
MSTHLRELVLPTSPCEPNKMGIALGDDPANWAQGLTGRDLNRSLGHPTQEALMARFTGSDRESVGNAMELVAVSKTYDTGLTQVKALDNVSLALPQGVFLAVMGPSGSGKSTLLNCASGLDKPDSGKVFIGGDEMPFKSERALTKFRRGRVELIFQQYNLLPNLTVEQNVTLPLKLSGRSIDGKAVQQVLSNVGLDDRRNNRPAELSGGQQQRVAIARCLLSAPQLLFADEPTGALDTRTAAGVLGLLRDTVRSGGRTVVMVTHDPVAAAYADSVIFLADGQLAGRLDHATPNELAERMTQLTTAAASAQAR